MARILPLWAEALTADMKLVGVDLPIDADPSQYRKAVMDIKNDPKALGAVVTTHKLRLYEHASDLFDDFDSMTKLTKDISTIVKRDNYLAGLSMPDCLSTALSLKSMLGAKYWHTNKSDVLCFGAGGVARAIALSLLYNFESDSPLTERWLYKPRRLYLVEINQQQLRSISTLLETLKETMEVKYICHSQAEDNDRLLTTLPIGSVVINATGMGKDRPGSPLTDQASFPPESIVWDLNYRGERHFLKQARNQESRQGLQIHDGWLCFMHGWTQTLQVVLQQTFSPSQFRRLAEIAEPFRTS